MKHTIFCLLLTAHALSHCTSSSGPETYKFAYIGFNTFKGKGLSDQEPCYSNKVKVNLYCDENNGMPTSSFTIDNSTFTPGFTPSEPDKIDARIVTQTCQKPNKPFITMSSPSPCCSQDGNNWENFTGHFPIKDYDPSKPDRTFVVIDKSRGMGDGAHHPWYTLLYTDNFDDLLTHSSVDCPLAYCKEIKFNSDYHDMQYSGETGQKCSNCDGTSCSTQNLGKKAK